MLVLQLSLFSQKSTPCCSFADPGLKPVLISNTAIYSLAMIINWNIITQGTKTNEKIGTNK